MLYFAVICQRFYDDHDDAVDGIMMMMMIDVISSYCSLTMSHLSGAARAPLSTKAAMIRVMTYNDGDDDGEIMMATIIVK